MSQTLNPKLDDYNTVVDYINAWNDIYIKAINDVQSLIDKYYNAGSLQDLHPFYNLLDEMKTRSEAHSRAIDFLYNRLKNSVQELL